MVELMVVMVMLAIVFAGITSTFTKQQEIYNTQEQEVQNQQNIRAARYTMTRELRMAGYDPQATGLYTITIATQDTFAFAADLNEDGGVPGGGELFQYQLYDSDGDGINDALRRTPGGSALANDISNLRFVYELQDPVLLTYTQQTNPAVADYPNILRVRAFLLARTSKEDRGFLDSNTYPIAIDTDGDGINETNLAPWGPFNDHYHRLLVNEEVTLRNMGL